MNATQRHYMIEAMRQQGGGFVVALADCFMHADSINFKKLCDAFPEYVKKYSEIGAEIERQENRRNRKCPVISTGHFFV